MERGLYAAASGMLAQQAIQEIIAQNIANASTVGYKQDNQTFRAVQGMALRRLENGMGRGPRIGELGLGCKADQVYTDWSDGSLTQSENPLDASLAPGQYFAVNTPRGERYTRAGAFHLDATGRLVTAGGLTVVGADGRPVQVTGAVSPKLDAAGNLLSGGQPVARLKVVQAMPNELKKEGDSLFAATAPTPLPLAARPELHPGTLEQSNVNTVRDLVEMITVSRAFEIAQRALTTQDEMLRRAANDIGRL